MASPVRISRTARAATITVVLAAFAVLPGCLQDSGEPGLFTGPSELVGTPVVPPPPPPASQPIGSLKAIIVFSPTSPAADQTVFFDGSDSTSPPGITSYAWNFGDGTTASGVAVSHTFSAAGTYVVRLTVTATDGSTATTTQDVVVSAAAPPGTLTAVITFSPTGPVRRPDRLLRRVRVDQPLGHCLVCVGLRGRHDHDRLGCDNSPHV